MPQAFAQTRPTAPAAVPAINDWSANYLQSTSEMPFKVLSVGTALAVGTQISVIRYEKSRLGKYCKTMSEQCEKHDGITPLMVTSIPGESLRAVGAVGEDVFFGMLNAVDYRWNKPFSPESLSLTTPVDSSAVLGRISNVRQIFFRNSSRDRFNIFRLFQCASFARRLLQMC